tara:strand:+ start:543 stop:644 length:102 start_codon:yes stop_codon:yes gene_type:complete
MFSIIVIGAEKSLKVEGIGFDDNPSNVINFFPL